jgi:DNA-binding response OmpR family regulator
MTPNPQPSDSEAPTVLILEDEPGLADLYAIWISDDYSVRTAYTASKARELFDDDVEIALIDRRLPDESGDAVLEWINREYPPCRTAMVTAVNPDFDILQMDFDEYLVKPVERSELHSVVDQLHEQRTYDDAVRRLYKLVQKRVHLEEQKDEAQLADSEEYADLVAEIEDVTDAVREASPDFGDYDFDAGPDFDEYRLTN